jgi:hypothetical protein
LQAHQQANGGVATYAEAGPIRDYMGLPDEFPIAGWCQPHVSVTGASGLAWAALGGSWREPAKRAWQYLQDRQHTDGYWRSYWWTCRQYPTYLAVALALALDAEHRRHPALRRAASWLQTSQLPAGGWALQPGGSEADFATALAVATLALIAPDSGALRRGANRLRWRQRHDGGWRSQPVLSIPPPQEAEPGNVVRWRFNALGTGVVIRDQHRLFTTATGLLGLLSAAEVG